MILHSTSRRMLTVVLVCAAVPVSSCRAEDWRTATRAAAGLAPAPQDEPRAVVQVYAARTVAWRGTFAVHSWIAVKEENGEAYTTFHVIGWRLRRGESVVVVQEDVPDRHWFGARPELVHELRGAKASAAIPKIKAAAESYPYKHAYRAWPGPNSNTFISHIIRNTPELGGELPPHAIGKDWIDDGDLFGVSETKTGFQLSLFGVLGVTLGLGEGIEFNILGLTAGLDLARPALKLPLVGRIGFADAAVFED